jgi:hypothetical protein
MEVIVVEPQDSHRQSAVPRALRLTFAYRGNDIRLLASERVEVVAPPAIGALPQPGQTGHWVQLADAAGRVVYHRALHQPIAVDAEVFPPERGQPITRVPLARREGRFSVLVPDLPGAAVFALHGPADPASDDPARELLRLDVADLRKHRPEPPAHRPAPDAPKGG